MSNVTQIHTHQADNSECSYRQMIEQDYSCSYLVTKIEKNTKHY